MKRFLVILFLLSIICSFIPSLSQAYVRFDERSGEEPILLYIDIKEHNVSGVNFMVSNQGPNAHNYMGPRGWAVFPNGEWDNNYVYGSGLWFGANYDADDDGHLDKVFSQGYNTSEVDSEFREGRGDQDPNDPLTRVFDSLVPEDLAEWPPQFSESGTGDPIIYSDQDLVTTYTTKDKSPIHGQFQMPLEVDQRSMAVTSGVAYNAIYFVFDVTNFSDKVLSDTWVGYASDTDLGDVYYDDLTSVVFDWVKPNDEMSTLDLGYTWDVDFAESSFTGTPGFVGVTLLFSPGNPSDGIDNDGDGVVDESPYNGVDDDLDGFTDEWDEEDEIGLINYSKFCQTEYPCGLLDPRDDIEGYDLMTCNTPGSPVTCLEGTTEADIRFMLSSGPFDWLPGQTHTFAFAFVFAYADGSPTSLEFIGSPPRPDPNDPILSSFLNAVEDARDYFPTLYMHDVGIENDPAGDPGIGMPKVFSLMQNYPNPFNPSTTIAFDIPGTPSDKQHVEVTIYDIRGRRVKMLIDSDLAPGSHKIHWDGRNDQGKSVSSGIYLYTLKTKEGNFTRKMTVLK
jgi:hypothetical protein